MPAIEYFRNRTRSRWGLIVLGVILVVAVWFITWALLNPEAHERAIANSFMGKGVVALPLALIFVPFLLLTIVLEGRKAFDDRPLLILDDHTIHYRDWRIGPISWGDVAGCELREEKEYVGKGVTKRAWYLYLRVRNAAEYLAKRHGSGEFSEEYQRRFFRIKMQNVRGERDEVLHAVESRLELVAD